MSTYKPVVETEFAWWCGGCGWYTRVNYIRGDLYVASHFRRDSAKPFRVCYWSGRKVEGHLRSRMIDFNVVFAGGVNI